MNEDQIRYKLYLQISHLTKYSEPDDNSIILVRLNDIQELVRGNKK